MNISTPLLAVAGFAIGGLLAGCAPDQQSSPPQAEAPAQKMDSANTQDLQAGLEAMTPRILMTVDAFSKVEPTRAHRYFMHPSVEKEAVIEFNIEGLAALTLSPRIGELSADCLADPLAGSVQMSWSLDDAPPTTLTIDRQYGDVISVDIGTSKKIRVEVGKGNDVVTCDWFGLGFLNVTPK